MPSCLIKKDITCLGSLCHGTVVWIIYSTNSAIAFRFCYNNVQLKDLFPVKIYSFSLLPVFIIWWINLIQSFLAVDRTDQPAYGAVNDLEIRPSTAQFTPPARQDKTVLSVSCLACRCELDDCPERVQTSYFLPATVLSCRESNSRRLSGHDTDKTVLSCLARRCELALRQTSYQNDVWRACVASGLPVLTPGTACHLIFISSTTLLFLNINLLPNFTHCSVWPLTVNILLALQAVFV